MNPQDSIQIVKDLAGRLPDPAALAALPGYLPEMYLDAYRDLVELAQSALHPVSTIQIAGEISLPRFLRKHEAESEPAAGSLDDQAEAQPGPAEAGCDEPLPLSDQRQTYTPEQLGARPRVVAAAGPQIAEATQAVRRKPDGLAAKPSKRELDDADKARILELAGDDLHYAVIADRLRISRPVVKDFLLQEQARRSTPATPVHEGAPSNGNGFRG